MGWHSRCCSSQRRRKPRQRHSSPLLESSCPKPSPAGQARPATSIYTCALKVRPFFPRPPHKEDLVYLAPAAAKISARRQDRRFHEESLPWSPLVYSPELVQVVSEIPSRAFVTATVWCVPFFGTVGLFNKLKRKKTQKNMGTPAAADAPWSSSPQHACLTWAGWLYRTTASQPPRLQNAPQKQVCPHAPRSGAKCCGRNACPEAPGGSPAR